MLKEIHEQPKAFKDTLSARVVSGNPISLDKINITKEQIQNINRIYIVACSTASEFRYRKPIINDKTLMIVMSQSGETADTLAALRG